MEYSQSYCRFISPRDRSYEANYAPHALITYKVLTVRLRSRTFKMGKLLFSSVLLLFVQYACTEPAVDGKPQSFHDPDEIPYRVSKLLNELGILIMDLDEGYSNQMPPKIELENEVKARMYGRPRSDYFSRIRENYKNIQRRIGSNVKDVLSVPSKLFGGDVKNEGQKATVDASVPLPVEIKLESIDPLVKETVSRKLDTAEESTQLKMMQPTKSSFAGEIKVDAEMKRYSTLAVSPNTTSDANQDEFLPQKLVSFGSPDVTVLSRRERDTGHLLRANDGVAALFAATYRDFMSPPFRNPYSFQNDTEIVSEYISRSSMDALTKKLVRYGQAALDSGMPRSEVRVMLDVIARSVLVRRKSTRKNASLSVTSESDAEATQKGKPEASLNKEPNDSVKPPGPDRGIEVKIPQFRPSKGKPTKATPRKETIFSAYTSDNVPIILRIGPEMGDPYRFLSGLLSLRDVSLRIYRKRQIVEEATESKNPVEVLFVDLSDGTQLNALVDTLRKFQRKRSELEETLQR